MKRRRSTRIVTSYVLSLIVAVALLVLWILGIVRSASRVSELAERVGVPTSANFHWVVLSVGCALLGLLIVGLTLQLANSFAELRYSRKQDEFVSNITHEMKSPLAAIKLHTQTLQQQRLPPEATARSLQFILQNTDRMSALVDDVLESSRLLARNPVPPSFEPVDLEAFLVGYQEETGPRVETRGLTFRMEIDTRAVVLASETALQRILDNLVDNALRFSHPGGEIRCRARDAGRRVVLAVEDDGVGIPAKDLPRIFDRFYQVEHLSDGRHRGTGLGLAIVAGLVREMKGSVRAESSDGNDGEERGTRILVELPRLIDQETAGPETAGQQTTGPETEGRETASREPASSDPDSASPATSPETRP